MSEEFVRKDYHDETIRRIEALMERNLAKHDAMNAKQEAMYREATARQDAMSAEIKGEIKNLHTRIDGVIDSFSIAINDLKERIDDIKAGQSNGFAKWAIIVAAIVGTVQVIVALLLK